MERKSRPGLIRRMLTGLWRGVDRLRQIREQLDHLFGRPEVMLMRDARTIFLAKIRRGRDAHQRIMSAVIRLLLEANVIGRYNR